MGRRSPRLSIITESARRRPSVKERMFASVAIEKEETSASTEVMRLFSVEGMRSAWRTALTQRES